MAWSTMFPIIPGTLLIWIYHSAHENDVESLFDGEQERMIRIEVDGVRFAGVVVQHVMHDYAT
jgi:hypothetical protein